MPAELTNVAWAQVRHDYEHTERPVDDICAEHGISAGTLRLRMRRWGWTRRRPPIPSAGPAPQPAPQVETAAPCAAAVPQAAIDGGAGAPDVPEVPVEPDASTIVPRLQSAVARVLPAIEQAVARLAAGSAHPYEMERAARALAALTRSLRELNSLLSERQAAVGEVAAGDDRPEDSEASRLDLARRIAFIFARAGAVPPSHRS